MNAFNTIFTKIAIGNIIQTNICNFLHLVDTASYKAENQLIKDMNAVEIADKLLLLKERADHDTQMQDYLRKAALPANLEYVRPERSGRRPGYFRRKSPRDSPKQLEHRLRFSKVAYNQFGVKGTIPSGAGGRISKAAKLIGNELRGTGSKNMIEKERERLIKILESKETTAKRIQASWI